MHFFYLDYEIYKKSGIYHSFFSTGEAIPLLTSALLGITNGIVGSVPMILAPTKVSDEHREITGNIMTLSYNIGKIKTKRFNH